jgi:hypothetical protein
VGTVREVLGSDAEDIFHWLRVRLTADRRDEMVPADLVTTMTSAAVATNLSRSAIEALPTYDEVATYHPKAPWLAEGRIERRRIWLTGPAWPGESGRALDL